MSPAFVEGYISAMCSHYISERRRAFYLKHYGIQLPADWEAPRGSSHVYPTQLAPIVRRPAERESGDETVPEFEVTRAHVQRPQRNRCEPG